MTGIGRHRRKIVIVHGFKGSVTVNRITISTVMTISASRKSPVKINTLVVVFGRSGLFSRLIKK